jgi:hypothetical protein
VAFSAPIERLGGVPVIVPYTKRPTPLLVGSTG